MVCFFAGGKPEHPKIARLIDGAEKNLFANSNFEWEAIHSFCDL